MSPATQASNPTGKFHKRIHHLILLIIPLLSNKPYSIFKPGQTALERDYYKDATMESADGAKCLTNYGRFGSEYGKNTSEKVIPGDYKVPSKDANNLIEYDLMNNPKLFAHTRRAGYDMAKTEKMLSKAGEFHPGNTTKHWQSNYVNTNETQMAAPVTVSERPIWSYPR